MIELSFLRTRIARRVFALFLLSALIPTVILAGIAYRQVNRQLTAQSVERLRQLSKLHGQALQERLAAASVDVADAARTIHQRGSSQGADLDSLRTVQTRFVAFDLTLGETVVNSAPSRRDVIEHLRSGRTLLDVAGHGGGSQVRLAVALDPEDPANGVLWGEIDPDYLWGSEDDRIGTAGTPVCVVRRSELLYCERAIPRESLGALPATVTSRESARFEWRDEQEGREFIAARWDAFLGREYLESNWSVVASMARDEILAPVSRFKATFLLTLLVSIGVVVVLSSIQIRRSLEPVRQLAEGTRRVANRDFEAQVEVSTRDEFGELAESFNLMAGTLERQFSTLEAMSDLDRAVLSSLDVSGIAETVLAKGARIARADSVAVGLIGTGLDVARVSTRAVGSAPAKSDDIPWTPSLTRELASRGTSAWMEPGSELLASLPSMDEELGGQLLLPLVVDGDVAGWMSLGYAPGHRCSEDDRSHARRLADQVSIGLANARLVERLDELGWGTIRALARTIDAKSRWTAGHSERVTAHAVRLGEALGLVSEDLTLIERGGLLHDIGKIGVPAVILDKPTRLTDEEYDVVKQHPVIGARILEPVAGLEPVIGMVRSHHERMDGAGYPDGLAGEDIPFLARLLAVADVWDSLRSERPYRPALPVELTTEIMIEGRGGHFDPAMLDVFLELDLDNERNPDEPESEAAIPDTQPLEETHVS
jgi:putative nucleotidyltransferase with HDIG domain